MAIIHFKCTKCHHEWDHTEETSVCDWCKGEGKELDRSKPFNWNEWKWLIDLTLNKDKKEK